MRLSIIYDSVLTVFKGIELIFIPNVLKELFRWQHQPPCTFDERLERLRQAQRGWAVAQSPILTTTITVSRLKHRGYEPLLDYAQ